MTLSKAQDDDERTTAVGLFHYAESYLACALKLEAEPPAGLIFDAPIEYQFLHAAELYLKAYLRGAGDSVKAVRALGHSLHKLRDRAREKGLMLSAPTAARLEFAAGELAMEARYIRTGYFQKLSMEQLREMVAEVRDGAGALLHGAGEPIRWRPGQ